MSQPPPSSNSRAPIDVASADPTSEPSPSGFGSGDSAGAILSPQAGEPMSGDRQERIRQAAYARAERRRFAPGSEDEDWLAAEREVDDAGTDDRS